MTRRQVFGRVNELITLFAESGAELPVPYRLIYRAITTKQSLESTPAVSVSVDALVEASLQGVDVDSDSLRELIYYIMNYKKGRKEVDVQVAVALFEHNCKHPGKTDLIFWPNIALKKDVDSLSEEEVFNYATRGF